MYSIGDLAQLGGVTPRMLRHYHDLGLLVPVEVDRTTGYRRYHSSQLADLLRILALKDLGLGLTDVGRIVVDGVGPDELRGMLRLRRTELEHELDEVAARLRRVERHIQRMEDQMTDQTPTELAVTTKELPGAHLAVLSAVSPSFASADIGPTIQPLYPPLLEALAAAGVDIVGPSIAFYEDDGDGVRVSAGFPIEESITQVVGVDVVDLPPVPAAATALHRGDMATVDVDTVEPVMAWLADHGLRTTGYSRELYLEWSDDLSKCRTELQFPIEPVG